MESEMIERVAKAIYKELTFGNELLDNPSEIKKNLYLRLAKAAILAMREPTDFQVQLGIGVPKNEHTIQNTWKAMIDAALKE